MPVELTHAYITVRMLENPVTHEIALYLQHHEPFAIAVG